jgi:glucose-1-phosphate thymidylyltransferase
VYEGDQITGFVEKPQEFISDLAIIGVYYFKDGEKLKEELAYVIDNDIKGPGGEYFLTEALDRMIRQGKIFKTATVDEWLDCGTLPAWLETTGVIVEKEAATTLPAYEGSTIVPPVYIAEGVVIEGSTVGPHVSIEAGAQIKGSTISNTIIRERAQLSGCVIEQSTVGAHTELTNYTGVIHAGDHSIIESK